MKRLTTGRRLVTVLITIIAILLLSATFVVANHQFSDVPSSPASTHDAVDFMKDNGITAGCNAAGTLYCPNNAVTRGQMAIFMRKLAGVTVSAGFHLVSGSITSWFNNVNGLAPTVPSCDSDSCEVDVKFPVANRFIQCTIDTNAVASRDRVCTASLPSGNLARVRAFDVSAAAGAADTTDYWVLIYGLDI